MRDSPVDVVNIATIGSWITYAADFDGLRKTVQLVWPRYQISILSPLGAALIGLHVGDKMPYLDDGRLHIIRIESLTRPDSKVIPLPVRLYLQIIRSMTIRDQPLPDEDCYEQDESQHRIRTAAD